MRDLTRQLETRLRSFSKEEADFEPRSGRAAVAMMVREGADATEMLMIRRATREGDPWSGHMAFPGGRRDPQDLSNFSCALRETEEEIGVDLGQWGTALGELSDVNTGWRKDRPEMLVAPFIFRVDSTPDFELNHEVDDTLWVPLSFLLDDANRSRHQWDWRGEVLESDAFTYDNRVIWGLSLMMIDELLEIIGSRAAGLESTSARVTRA